MRSPTSKPLLFLAFANDRQADGAYLRNLGQEAEAIRAALAPAIKAGLCELDLRASVSAEGILALFHDPAAKGRIALFHYAGHAEDYDLLLESANGERALADGRGLAAFLRQQTGLRLLFLNACSTRVQVEGLLAAGIAAVIATSRAIDDQTATDFARHFYTALAGGDSIRTSFEKAQAALHFVRGESSRHLRPTADPLGENSVAGWPWALYLRKGAEENATWNLPSAAQDPLFGLPPLPAMDLPAKPFRDLSWFRRADAPIFFGRGHQIRELYTTVTDPLAAPIVLFYGQSGVGKSSLLDAGLLPRLEQVQRVLYLRRDQQQGLLGTLVSALSPPPRPEVPRPQRSAELTSKPGEGTAVPLLRVPLPPQFGEGWGEVWHAIEQAEKRPLTLILDQVEEYFTRPNPALPDEMAQFLQALVALFSDRNQRPQGKLLLSFRKEWLAELEKRLSECGLPLRKLFLERLDEAGVINAISGVAVTPALQQQYGLQLADGLAEAIAHDLLNDREAAIAPMLQILLSRLWEEATVRNRAQPCFDHVLYDQLRRDGLKLAEFLDRQLTRLKAEQPAVVESGLALDLLSFHTTPLGTAEQRTFAALQAEYQPHTAILADLVRSLQNLYLLVDQAADQTDSVMQSRLAHDTLAPLVRARFDESDLPGQRARRILETRALDWVNGTQGTPLDEVDLRAVEAGLLGMRMPTPDEDRIIKASLAERQQRSAERQRQEQERITTEQNKHTLERSLRHRLQVIVGILAVISCTLLGLLLNPYFWSWYVRGELIFIPAAQAVIGTNDPNANALEGPQSSFPLAAYYIEKFEVTNAQYDRCVRVGVCRELRNARYLSDPLYRTHPVVGVTAIQAATYCRWLGRRLPTELEWEHAARNTVDTAWPWGDEPPNAERVQMPLPEADPLASTVSVTTLAAGASRSTQIYNLIGNAKEWTSSPFQTYTDYKPDLYWNGMEATLEADAFLIIRGGGYDQAVMRVTERGMLPADETVDSLGFRCAT